MLWYTLHILFFCFHPFLLGISWKEWRATIIVLCMIPLGATVFYCYGILRAADMIPFVFTF